jgi:TonB family protein
METLQLEKPAVRSSKVAAPQLLVEWSPRWEAFKSSIGPALGHSEPRLAGEAPFGLIPFRIMGPSYVLEALAIFLLIAIPTKIAQMRPYVAPRLSAHDIIYYSGDELPRTEDLGGAESGKTGRAGGDESYHRTQTIKIARGGSLVPKVVDAPNLKLPSSRDAVANLLAIRPDAGPPPSEGFRSNRSAPRLQTSLVAPAPNLVHDYTRNGIALNQVVAPAPTISRAPVTAPNLSATVIPPAPDVNRDHALVAPALAPSVVPPAENVSREHGLTAPRLDPFVPPPAPTIARDKMRSAPTVAANIIPPAPGSVTRQYSSAPVQMTDMAVVPPPVSSPERATLRNPKLALPTPAVVAPPPSSDISQDVRHLASGSVPDPSKSVVPPPQAQAGSGSFVSSLIGKIFGPSEVVAPPPTVSANSSRNGTGTSLAPNVVAPPPSAASNAGGSVRGNRNGAGTSLSANVVAPPSSTGVSGGTGSRTATAPMLGPGSVVPPPPSIAGSGGGSGNTGGGRGAAGGTLEANNIVPPPPSMSGSANSSGSGLGRRGSGLGSPMNVGSDVAPPTAGGSGSGTGAVISNQPGSKVGLPSSGGQGALAMSPSGGEKLGLGGSGGGSGIGRGNGSGSGVTGEGYGAGKSGTGRGSDPNAHSGISPAPGPGGAGNAPNGTPPVPGVAVSGGTSVVTLPSFGDSDSGADPVTGKRSSLKQRETLGVTVVATASSGGAFEPYKHLLHGETYTTYVDTSIGTAVMEFADESAKNHPFGGTLSAPQAVRSQLPDGLPRARMVLTCTLDAAGNLRNVRVLEAGPADMTAKVIAALRSWKFQPALRGNQPVEVTAILGFGINTDDRF